MTKVVLVGERVPGGLIRSLHRGLEQSGARVTHFNWPDAYLRPSVKRIAFRWPLIATSARERFVSQMSRIDGADAVIVVKGGLLSPRSIASIRSKADAPVVCWNPDSPFDSAVSNRGGHLRHAVGHYDLYVTWSQSLADDLARLGQRTIVVPFGWDDMSYFPPKHRIKELVERPVFVGTWTQRRQRALSSLRSSAVVVFGHRWPRDSGFEVMPAVYEDDYRTVVASAGCAINLLRTQNADSHNMRTFELPACGALQVAPRTHDHERWLTPQDCILFDSYEELATAVDSALSRPRFDITEPPKWLYAHTYAARARSVLAELGIR